MVQALTPRSDRSRSATTDAAADPIPEGLEVIFEGIARLAVRAVPACDAAGVFLTVGERVVTVASSESWVTSIDSHQLDAGEGPSLDTLRTGEHRRSESLVREDRWPEFGSRALAEGVVSCLAVPLLVGRTAVGTLNMYSRTLPFHEVDEEISRELTTPAAAAMAYVRAHVKSQEVVLQLQEALQSRDVIGQAKGVLRARTGCTAEEAFDLLRAMSQHRNCKLRAIAQDVVDTVGGTLVTTAPGRALPSDG